MDKILLMPPVTFVIVLAAAIALSSWLSSLSFRRKGDRGDIAKAYACGEDVKNHLIHPDYGQFFPFAFFFTILHVIALIVTTVPHGTVENVTLAMIYVICAVVGLLILFRR